MTIANLLIRVAPHVTLRRLVGAAVLCWALVHIVWPYVSITAGAFARTDFDKAVLESGRVNEDVSDIVAYFVQPNERFEHIVERLWELGFETEKIVGAGIYRHRTVPPQYGPDERWRSSVLRYNRMLDEHDAAYMAYLTRLIPGTDNFMIRYNVLVFIFVREDQSTAIEARSFVSETITLP